MRRKSSGIENYQEDQAGVRGVEAYGLRAFRIGKHQAIRFSSGQDDRWKLNEISLGRSGRVMGR